MKELHCPQIVVRDENLINRYYPQAHFVTYGLGWVIYDDQGYKIVEHGGAVDGNTALLSMIPEMKLGLVLLSNLGSAGQPLRKIKSIVFDNYISQQNKDY